MNFRVALTVNPLLATDLNRFTMGKSRHARLMALATIGLMSEMRSFDGGPPPANLGRTEMINARPNGRTSKTRLADQDFAEIGE